MKMLKHLKPAFTLSEMMVVLAILGLVTAFAIPKVLTAMGDHQNAAIFRETFGALSNATFEGVANGSFTTVNDMNFWTSKMNAVRICNDADAEGCWPGASSSPANTANQGGVLLPSGAMVTDIESGNGDHVWIDVNGANGPNIHCEDQLPVVIGVEESTIDGVLIRGGTVVIAATEAGFSTANTSCAMADYPLN